MKNVINQLVEELDKDTSTGVFRFSPLQYAGQLDKSPFLRAIVSKAKVLGIPCEPYKWERACNKSVVIDHETVEPFPLGQGQDIDNLYNHGMSCVSEAVFMLLTKLNLIEGKNITIVGRGHSVKNLAETLLAHNATVTIAHSGTKSLIHSTAGQNVVIYATPTLIQSVAYDTMDLVIDLGNCVPRKDLFSCPCVDNIGRLTISVLMNRHATGGI